MRLAVTEQGGEGAASGPAVVLLHGLFGAGQNFGAIQKGLAAAGRRVLDREEGQDGAGAAGLVTVIQVIGTGVVEVDGLLDEAEPEDTPVEVEVAGDRAREGRDVVEAGCGHGDSSWTARAAHRASPEPAIWGLPVRSKTETMETHRFPV